MSALGQRNRKASRKLIFMLRSLPRGLRGGGAFLFVALWSSRQPCRVGTAALAGWEDASWCLVEVEDPHP